MAQPGILQFVSQKCFDLAFGGRGELDLDLVVEFAGDRVEEQLGARDIAELCYADLADRGFAMLAREGAAGRGADRPPDPPAERLTFDPVLEALGGDRALDASVFHVDGHWNPPLVICRKHSYSIR